MTNAQKQRANVFFRLGLIFLMIYIVLNIFAPAPPEQVDSKTKVVTIKASKEEYSEKQLVEFFLLNQSAEKQIVSFELLKEQGGDWQNVDIDHSKVVFAKPGSVFNLSSTGEECQIIGDNLSLAPDSKCRLHASQENNNIFLADSNFNLRILDSSGEYIDNATFSMVEAGFFKLIWRTIFFKPIENALLFFVKLSGYQLWLAIILLTILIKTILIIPSKKGIIAQRKMQKIQPELDALKKKYASDQQKQMTEMMALFKKHKVHPMSALTPTLIQMPVLIALFFVVQMGLMPHNSYLLYPIPYLANIDFTLIDFNFLWMQLDLIHPLYTLPLALFTGIVQFWQMQSIARKNAKKNDQKKQHAAIKVMNYVLPIIIVIFSITMPPAVALYWATSTVFSIVQQYMLKKND